MNNHQDRPESAGLVDLHVYVIPPDLWQERQRSAVNQIISETVSAGFIRAYPEMLLNNLRDEIDKQIGFDLIPRDFVFCKSVGRCLAQVRSKQEVQMKVKHFTPPHAYCPEIFVLDADTARRAQMSSDGSAAGGSRGGRFGTGDPNNPSGGYANGYGQNGRGGDPSGRNTGGYYDDADGGGLRHLSEEERRRLGLAGSDASGLQHLSEEERRRLGIGLSDQERLEQERRQRMEEEERLRQEEERRRQEHERRLQEERDRMEEERRRGLGGYGDDVDGSGRYGGGRGGRDGQYSEEQRAWEEERRRMEEEARRREEEEAERIRRAENQMKIPNLLIDEATPMGASGSEKDKLVKELQRLKEERGETEQRREDLIKRARVLHVKASNQRNQARDMWKKRYFEEKKKTPPLESQVNKLRAELETLHRKIVSTMESGIKEKHKYNRPSMAPSEQDENDIANLRLQATRLEHEIEELQRRVDDNKGKLTTEIKLRNQAEAELRALRADLTQKKIGLSLTRNQQLSALGTQDVLSVGRKNSTLMSPRH